MAVAPAHAATTEAPPAAPPKPLKLRVAHMQDETHPWHKAFERFRDVLGAKAEAHIEAEIFPAGKLGVERDYVSYLRQGVLDVATITPNGLAPMAPEVTFLDLLFLWRDRVHWRRAFDGDVGQAVTKLIRAGSTRGGEPGVEVLGYWGGSDVHILSRSRGYRTVEDFAGAKVRVQDSALQIEMWTALGARPISLPFDLVPAALEDGRIDAVLVSTPTALAQKLYERAPHLSRVGLAINARAMVMSGQTWARLDARQREAVAAAARAATDLDRELEAEQSDVAVERLAALGVKVYAFEARALMRERLAAIQRRTARDLGLTDLLSTIENEWAPPRPSP